MPPLSNLLPTLPWDLITIIMNVVAGLGAVLLTYPIFLESERKQDGVLIVASACLLVYALWIGNKIFSIAMAGLLIGSAVELTEILLGRHTHSEEMVEKYKNQ